VIKSNAHKKKFGQISAAISIVAVKSPTMCSLKKLSCDAVDVQGKRVLIRFVLLSDGQT